MHTVKTESEMHRLYDAARHLIDFRDKAVGSLQVDIHLMPHVFTLVTNISSFWKFAVMAI